VTVDRTESFLRPLIAPLASGVVVWLAGWLATRNVVLDADGRTQLELALVGAALVLSKLIARKSNPTNEAKPGATETVAATAAATATGAPTPADLAATGAVVREVQAVPRPAVIRSETVVVLAGLVAERMASREAWGRVGEEPRPTLTTTAPADPPGLTDAEIAAQLAAAPEVQP
jgi:hypothetical protein